MSKIELATVNTPLNSHEFQDQINRNFEKVSEALDNQLQRTAQDNVVNSMEQELNMGGNRIINLAKAVDPSDAMRKKEFDEQISNIEQWAQEAKDSAASAAEDADDAEAAKRVAISAAESAQRHENAVQELHDALLADEHVPVVADNIADVITVAENIEDVNTTADNMEDIKAVFDIAKRIAYGNIGDIRATFAATAPDGCRFADGSVIRREDYPELFEMLDNGGIPFDSVSVWTSNVNNHGITGAFGYDEGSSEAYLPLLTEAFVEATNNTPHRVNAAGLPNITGEAGNYGNGTGADYYSSGAMYVRAYTGVVGESEDTQGVSSIYGIDASRSSSVYGKSDTVQPKSVMLRHYVVLTNSRQMFLTWREAVATRSDLPTTGNINGDIRVVKNEGVAYVWARTSRDSWMWSSVGRFGTGAGGPVEWGYIEGDMTQQADLQLALDKKITNNATGHNIAIGTSTMASYNGIAIGRAAQAMTGTVTAITKGVNIAIGDNAQIIGSGTGGEDAYNIAIGKQASVSGSTGSVSVGYLSSVVEADNAIQLGEGTNSSEGTLQFRDYPLVDANGKIPAERLPDDIGGSDDCHRSLSETQKTQILIDGTYEGSEVTVGEVFTEYDGKFVEFDKVYNNSADWVSQTQTDIALDEFDNIVRREHLAEGNGRLVLAYGTSSLVSLDGINWTQHDIGSSYGYRLVVFNGSEFVAISGEANYVAKSTDGMNWTEYQRVNGPSESVFFEYTGTEYVALSSSGTYGFYTSPDAITWTLKSDIGSLGNTNYRFYYCAKGPDKYVCMNRLGEIIYSTDLVNWTLLDSRMNVLVGASYGDMFDIVYANGLYNAVSSGGSGGVSGYYWTAWSEDGINWTKGTRDSTYGSWDRIKYLGNKWYVVGRNKISVSEDGKHFTNYYGELPTDVSYTYLSGLFYGKDKLLLFMTKSSGKSQFSSYKAMVPFYEYFLLPLSYTKDEADAALTEELTGVLKNLSTATNSLSIAGTASTSTYSTNVGYRSRAKSNGTSLGHYAYADGIGAIAIGTGDSSRYTQATGFHSMAIGPSASGYSATKATASYAIQLGMGTNSEANTFSVGLASNKNYKLLNADGTIPAERLVNAPAPDLSEYTTRSSFTGSNGISMGFKEVNDYTLVGTLTISDGVVSGYTNPTTNYLQVENRVTQARPSSYEIICAFTVASLPSNVSAGRIISVSTADSETNASTGIAINESGILRAIGPAGLTGTTVFTAGTKVYAKLTYDSTTGYVLYSSTDGVTWNQEASNASTGFNLGGANMFVGRFAATINPTIYLKECYALVDGVEVWRGYSEKFVAELEAPTQEATTAPTTATVGKLGQVYVDSATGTGYMCVGVDTATPAYTWKQVTA